MVITLGRQHGSNGHLIAKKLAEELNYRCFDKEIVDEAASNSKFSREIFASFDEKRVPAYIMPTPHFFGVNEGFKLNIQVVNAQFDTIKAIAEKDNCIFVGRCADYILRDRKNLLRVFIKSDMDTRIKTLSERKGLTEDQARKLIKEVDKDRSSFYRYNTDQIWGESENYDLCIDSGKVSIEGAVEVIKAYMNAMETK